MTKHCNYCGTQTGDNSLFCPKCGKPMPHDNVCPQCGATISDGDVFCPKCGASVQVYETDDKNISLDEGKVKDEKKKPARRKPASSRTQTKKRRATPKNQSSYDISEDNNEELSLAKKIGLCLAIAWTLLSAYIGFCDGNILFIVVSAIFFVVLIYVFNTPTAFRYTWWAVVLVIVGSIFTLALIDEHNNAQSAAVQSEINRKEDKVRVEEDNKKDESGKLSSEEQKMADTGFAKGNQLVLAAAAENESGTNLESIEYLLDSDNEALKSFGEQFYKQTYRKPTNAHEEKLKQIYVEYFLKGLKDGLEKYKDLQ